MKQEGNTTNKGMIEHKGKAVALALALILGIYYFIPASALEGIIPEALISHRTAGPLLILTIAGIFYLPPLMTAAMFFSFLGDLFGTYQNFIGQMSTFAVAHALMVTYFILRLKKNNKGRSGRQKSFIYLGITTAVCLFAFACIYIVPYAPAGGIRIGASVYAFLICSMLATAMMQRNGIFTAGALLFVFSDAILAWNKFVTPLEWENFLIIVPYFSAQMLLWFGASKDIIPKR